MSVEFKEIRDGVVWASYPTRFAMCSAMMRLQEYYESPNKKFRRKFFTMEEYIDWYAETNPNFRCKNKFTYWDDWSGFNIPGNIVSDFYGKFERGMNGNDLWDKEMHIFSELERLGYSNDNEYDYMGHIDNSGKKKFYLIATSKGKEEVSTLKHELAHAYYYLHPQYKKDMDAICGKENPKTIKHIVEWMLSIGYNERELIDETQAYLSTTNDYYWKKCVKFPLDLYPSNAPKEYYTMFDANEEGMVV